MIFTAMLRDAYRELNSKRLFWVVLALSGCTGLVYLSIGFNPEGMSLFFGLWQIDSEFIREGSPIARILYRSIFSSFIVTLWLAWIAVILALISTASIFPDFMQRGAIDIMLSKPVARWRIFLYKYLASLIFVVMQVALISTLAFLALGFRLGDWEWRIFWAIPIVTLMFSYLFSVSVFVGTLTRSTLTALLAAMLFWVTLFSLAAAHNTLGMIRVQTEIDLERTESRLSDSREHSEEGAVPAALELQAEAERKTVDTLRRWEGRIGLLRTPLPKTGETIELIDRQLRRDTDVNIVDIFQGNVYIDAEGDARAAGRPPDQVAANRLAEETALRNPPWKIIGISLLFECLLIGAAMTIFQRREF